MAENTPVLALLPPPALPWEVAHESRGRVRLRIPLLGKDPDRCAAVASQLRAVPGLRSVTATARLGTLTVRYAPRQLDRRQLDQCILDALAEPAGAARAEPGAGGGAVDASQLALLALGLAVTPLLPLPARYAVTTLAISPSLVGAFGELRRPRLGSGVQDAAALVVATLAGRYGTAQLNNFLHRLARYLEQQAVENVEAGLRQRVRLPQRSYPVHRQGRDLRLAPGALLAGDRLVLRDGDTIPVQGMVVAGEATVIRNGAREALPLAPGALLAAGARVGEGELHLALLQDWKDGSYRRLQSFVETVVREREGAGRYASGLADRLAPYSLLISSAVFGFTRSLRRSSSTLQADFGSALSLVAPVAVETAMASAAAGGILYRSGDAMEQLAAGDCFVFDKTGTLSDSAWHLTGVAPAAGVTAGQACTLLAEVVLHCLRPRVAGTHGEAPLPPVTTLTHHEMQQLTTHGLQLRRGGRLLGLLSAAQARERLGLATGGPAERNGDGTLQLCLTGDGELLALFSFDNPVASEAAATIAALRAEGVGEVHMITHEPDAAIPPALRTLDLDGIHASLDELDKQDFLAGLEARGRRVVLVSDGLFQARGSCLTVCLAASPEARQLDADVWLLWPQLESVTAAHRIARRAARRLARTQRTSVAGNGAVLLAASFDVISSTVAAMLSNSITLGLLQHARNDDEGTQP